MRLYSGRAQRGPSADAPCLAYGTVSGEQYVSFHPVAFDLGTLAPLQLDLGALSGAEILTWCVAPGMYIGCGGAVRKCPFPSAFD
jgi:hypothetical protein